MIELFSKTDIDFMPLIDYVSWFLDSQNSSFDLIQLPPIQRNPAWNVNQVEKLWDSILRGFPIGSFLLSSRKKGMASRGIYSIEQLESKTKGFFLLDGQQRTRAILLGFKPNDNSRLWIDLCPNLSFDNSEYNDRKFLFRLITKHQPWGMNDRVPTNKLSEPEKYYAREELYGESVRYDYNVEINLNENNNSVNKYSWPVKSQLPIPFDALVNLCGGFSGNFIQPKWEKVSELIPSRYKSDKETECPKHFFQIVEALKKVLDNSNSCNRIRSVSFLNQNEFYSHNDDTSQDSMEVLFRRINSLGTQLEGEEMAYSLLKSSWDEAYNLVSNIVNDKEIGYVFSSTGIVMAATRMARFNLNKNDEANPSVSNFRKWIGEKDIAISFLDEMKSLMNLQGEKSKFYYTLKRFCNVALYREGNSNDIGLPRKLLLSIKPTMLHPVLIWLQKNKGENDRNNILRYLIYSFIGVIDHDKASKKAVEIIKENYEGSFPDFEIYSKWVEDEIAIQLPNIATFENTLVLEADGFLRSWHEVMGDENDIHRDFRNCFWDIWKKKELLLWFQRDYCSKWFIGYNPMSNDASDTPYDCDHIVPYSHLISSGSSANTYSEDSEKNKRFFDFRYLYMNSIGNLRIWPSWANRSDNNICHTIKLRMSKDELEIDGVAKELLFKSNKDFVAASIINLNDFDLWRNAGGDPKDWDENRRIAWQQAVENRVLFLFQIFYNSFGFSNWSINN